jgi:hypothetical protein
VTVAVVLHYRTPFETTRAVRSLLDSACRPAMIVVVENDAAGRADRAPVDAFPEAVRLVTGRNLGFAAGINRGVDEARRLGAGRVLLVNSDATLDPVALGRLEGALDRMPGAGIAGPVVLSRGEPGRIESTGIRYASATGRMRLIGHGRQSSADSAAPAAAPPAVVDATTGCVMLVDVRVFDAIGQFDDEYFYGFEDLDFCLRASRAGFASIVVPDARAWHDGARSIGADSTDRLYYAARNHLRLAGSRASNGRSRLRELSIVGWNVAHALRAPVRRVPARLAAVARGVHDYRRGRFGPA